MNRVFFCLLPTAYCLLASVASAAEGWKAGVAETVITPDELMWMSGYGARDHVAEGKNDELMCKALVLDGEGGTRAVLITLDLVGIDRATSHDVCRLLEERFGLKRHQVAINCSHTHCGPVVRTNLRAMYALSEPQWKQVERYTESLTKKIVETVGAAIAKVEPVRASWGGGRCEFAVNRRENKEADVVQLRAKGFPLKGPSDHDVPVLAVHGDDGKLRAVVFGYACHATTLSFYNWSADYPGFAYRELQRQHPGAVALFWAGCGADQNPLPRRTVELAEQYGKQLAESVDAVLSGGGLKQLAGSITTAYEETTLDFQSVPTKEELETAAAKGNKYEQGRARLFLEELAAGRSIEKSYPYPIAVWKFGDGPTWALLGGEVVVDYALRLKDELGPAKTWVAGYTNDVMAYIPSRRVLAEGGYEGASSMVIYGRPSPWAPTLEEAIVRTVKTHASK